MRELETWLEMLACLAHPRQFLVTVSTESQPPAAPPAQPPQVKIVKEHNEALAALLSFLIPGVGQFYNREILRGLFWLIVTPTLWIGSAGHLGWIFHIIAAYTAYSRAGKINQRREQ